MTCKDAFERKSWIKKIIFNIKLALLIRKMKRRNKRDK